MAFNYKRLNDNTKDDKYPFSNKIALINKIKNNFIYSKFDFKLELQQVPLAKNSRPKTTFITHNGHYEWTVMLFGLKNALQVLQINMDDIFRKYFDFIITYLDDILVFSKSVQEHVQYLLILFKECQENDLALLEKQIKI